MSLRRPKTKRGFQSAFHYSEAIDCFFSLQLCNISWEVAPILSENLCWQLNGAALSPPVGRELAFNGHVRRSTLHNHRPAHYVQVVHRAHHCSIVALDSRRCLSPKFHANTHNHTTCHCPVKPLREREPWPAAIDKATRVRCRLWAESKVWVIRPNQLFRNLSDDFHRSKFPMPIVWDAAGSKNWWEFSGKAQRPTLRSSCLQSQLWQFVRIMRRFLRLNITSSPGNLWQIVIYCSVMTETETNAKYSKYSLSVPVLKFETVLVFFARITAMEIRGKNSHLAMAITWETSRIWWEIWLAAKTWQRASRGSFLFSEDLLWRWKQTTKCKKQRTETISWI